MRCPRGRLLAWLEADVSGSPVVVTNVVSPGREARTVSQVRMPAADVRGPSDDPLATLSVTATCSCGDRWSVDLIAVLEGRAQRLVPDTWLFPGASFDR